MITTLFAFDQFGLNTMMVIGFGLVAFGVIGKVIQGWRASEDQERQHSRWMFILSEPRK